jgi:lipopolysaccharide biosynthesis glycosyltransferase
MTLYILSILVVLKHANTNCYKIHVIDDVVTAFFSKNIQKMRQFLQDWKHEAHEVCAKLQTSSLSPYFYNHFSPI